MTYRAHGYSNDCTLSRRGCATSDVTPSTHVPDEYVSERDRQDCSDTLSSLLATAAVALNTNRRVTRRCIQRAAVLLGIDLIAGADGTSRVPLSQVALACGMCDQAHFSRTFRRIVGTNPGAWRRQFLLDTGPGEHASAAG